MPPRIKICGITNRRDAFAAHRAGADYLGFIFYPPSKRSISPEKARELARELGALDDPPVLVGVFVDEPAEKMASILDQCSLDLAQLSGNEPAAIIGDPSSPLYGRCYKALKPRSLSEAEAEVEWYVPPERRADQPALLLDAYHPSLPGGTGLQLDWSIASRVAASLPGLMLAGGLTPENVASAVKIVNPYAVDVASGVESKPGMKDQARMEAFVAAVRSQN